MMTQARHYLPRRKPLTRRWCALASLLLLLTAGCNYEFPGKPKPADRPIPEDQSLSFDILFRRNCAGCHGAEGRLGPAPPLNDPIFLAIIPDAELLRVIQAGRHGTPMPAFLRARGGPLTDAQVKVLADGIKSRWKPSGPPDEALPDYLASTENAPPSASQDPHAVEIFGRACAGCHGANGQGTKGKSPVGAVNDPAFLSLISDQALRRIIITGRPDLKMPDFAGTAGRPSDFQALTSAEINELVALLGFWRHGEQFGPQP
jgi:cytochrome c oxidase cbb3-type subunit III